MGKLKNLNSFTGKVGDVVGYEVNGKAYIKRKPVRKAPLTEGELKQINTFIMVQKWVNPISAFLRLGYHGANSGLHALNAAKSAIHKKAVDRELPQVLPELVKVSTGELALAENMDAFLINAAEVSFLWDPQIPIKSSPRDRIMMLAYNPDAAVAFMELAGPSRSTGIATLPLDSPPAGSYHLYAAFISEDRRRQSESVYLGVVEV